MGEMAEMYDLDFDVGEDDPGYQPASLSCKYCGKDDLYWFQDWDTDKWRLVTKEGHAHKCRRSAT